MLADSETTRDRPSASRRDSAHTKVLAVDLGTSYFKAGLFNHLGELEVLQSLSVPATGVARGQVELDVAAFRASVTELIQSVAAHTGGLQDVRAVSFATQANSFAMFDAANEPLTPFILWPDSRAKDEEDAVLDKLASVPRFCETTGVAQLNHLFLPAKFAWFRRHELRIVENTARIAQLSDYFTWWLSGQWWTEAAVAGLTGLANIHSLEWSLEALSISQIDVQQLPRIVRAGTSAGIITPEVAREWSFLPDCEFVIGCLDQFAGAIGAGNVSPGMVSETTGTVLATIRCAEGFNQVRCDEVFQGPGFREGIFYQMLFSELSAGLLERYRSSCAPGLTFAELDELAATVPRGSAGLRVRADDFHRRFDDSFVGRNADHTRAHEVRAILEAVAGELARQVRALTRDVTPERIVAGGGAARSELWLKIKSETLGCPVVPVDCEESTCRGAALLALSALTGSSIEQLAKTVINS